MTTGKLYPGCHLQLDLDTDLDLTAASVRSIEIRPPDGVPVSLPATQQGANVLRAEFLLNTAGEWRGQPKAVIDGKVRMGETFVWRVYPLFG